MAVTLGLILVASLKKAWSMTFIAVRCPPCQRNQSVQRGNTARGTPRSLCQHPPSGSGDVVSSTLAPVGACLRAHTRSAPCVSRPGAGVIRRAPCLSAPTPCGGHARSTQEGGRRCPPRGCAPCLLPRGPGPWSALGQRRRRGMRGGRWSGIQAPRAGSGLPALPTPARAGPMAVGAATPPCVGGSQRCWRPTGCPARLASMGAPPRGTAIPPSPAPAHATRRKARASL